jgi:hypothetical protein
MAPQHERAQRIEAIVDRLKNSLTREPSMDASDGLSAVFTLAARFAKGMLLMSQTEGDRENNRAAIVRTLHQIADEIEGHQIDPPVIH